jgi:cobalt-zinc-cadmium resistance protein CzcA
LVRSAELSYAAGEIDFFRFAESMDRAVGIELNYLENLYQYNQRVLDINYLILEN